MSAGAASDALAPQVCNTLLTPRLLHGSAALGLRGPRDSETRQQDTGGANGATPRSAVSRRSTVGNRLDYRPDASRRRADGSFCRTGLLRPRKPRGVRNAPSPEWPVSTSGRTCRTCRTCRHLPHSGLATKTVVRVATESRLHTTRQGHPRESPGSTAITSPGHHVAWPSRRLASCCLASRAAQKRKNAARIERRFLVRHWVHRKRSTQRPPHYSMYVVRRTPN
jgi:hypothetical protein